MTVANPQASEQPAPQTSPREEGIRRAAEIYHHAGIRTGNETAPGHRRRKPGYRRSPGRPQGDRIGRGSTMTTHSATARQTYLEGADAAVDALDAARPAHTAPTVT